MKPSPMLPWRSRKVAVKVFSLLFMKLFNSPFSVVSAAVSYCLTLASLTAQQPPVPAPAPSTPYDMAVTVQASKILQPGLLAGPLHRIREDVVTEWGINTYAVDSDLYGTLIAHGNTQLLERITEISAMKRIDEMTQSEEYGKAVRKATHAESEAAEDFVPEPADRIEKMPKSGIGKFFHRIGQNIREDDEAERRSDYQEYQNKSTVGVANAKRDLCRKLGVNPYTSNVMLQSKLTGMSKALGVGGFVMVQGPASADDSLAAVLLTTQLPPQATSFIYEKPPEDLRVIHQTNLQTMGVTPVDAASFLANPVFTPWLQTQFVTALQALPGVTGRDLLVRDAHASSTEDTDAIFYTETAQLLARLATENWQISSIALQKNAPYCILRDGSVLLALHWDYARWSSTADQCAGWLQTLQVDGKKPASITIAITGLASPTFRQEMEKRGFKVLDQQVKGPLK